MRKRAERRWTVMLVPHGSGSSRAVELSHTVVKAFMGIGGVIVALVVVLGVAAIVRGVNITRNRALERENRILAGEIQRMRERLVGLRDTINSIGQREQELRLLAGLNPIDPGVQQGGIGGPSGTWSERDSLAALGPDGRQALAARMDVDALIRRADILVRSVNQAYDSLHSHQARFAATPSIMPTAGWISSAFAAERVHPILHLARPHEGIDVSAPMGAEIEAPAAVQDPRRPRAAGEAGTEGRARRLDWSLHRPAPPLRGVGERPRRGSEEVCVAGRDCRLKKRAVKKRRRRSREAAVRRWTAALVS